MKYHRTEYLKIKLRGRPARVVFTRRKIRVARPCSRCGRVMPVGSLFWRRGHWSLHIECFEQLKRSCRTVNIRGAGRKPALNINKVAAIVLEMNAAASKGTPINCKAVARQVGTSESTVRRFVSGQYYARIAA